MPKIDKLSGYELWLTTRLVYKSKISFAVI